VGKTLKESLISKVNNIAEKTFVIPNGYDEYDFAGIIKQPPERFTVSYTGTLSDTYPIDGFLNALHKFRSEGNEFILRFVGTVSPEQKDLIILKAGKEVVEFIPYVDHRSAIKYMSDSSLLLLIIPDHKSNKSIITGKIFEYIATGRPILCLGPADGDAASILNESGHGITLPYDDSSSIAKALNSYSTEKSSYIKSSPGEYSRRELTQKLCSLIEKPQSLRCGIVVDNDLNNDIRVLREIEILRRQQYAIFALCFGFRRSYNNAPKQISVTRIRIQGKLKDTLFFLLNTIPVYEWLWAGRISKFIKSNKIEILHVHDLYMAKAAHRGIEKSGKNIPLILDLHENYPFTVRTYNWTKGFLRSMISKPEAWGKKEKEYLGYATRIIVLSDDFKVSLLSRYPELSDNLFTVLPNVPDLLQTSNNNNGVIELPFSQKYPVIFYYGVIAERRGVFDALEVFINLVKENHKVNFLLIGPVDKMDKDRFMSFVNMELLSGRIHYIPWINSTDLPGYLNTIDICIAPFHKNPQHESGVANKIYEYMLGSKPLVVSNCLPQQNLIEKHKCGLVFETRSELSKQLIKLINDSDLRDELGKNGLAAVQNYYNTGNVEKNLISLYKTII
jgi:glycosyltransferase involved in cell wall biosynthesis